MKKTTIASLWIAIACMCSFFSSCSKNESSTQAEKDSELHLYMQADIVSFDPRVGYDRRSIQILRELFEGLMRIGKDGKTELALAKSLSISDDKTVYTFHLHPSKWSNGLDLTAGDFVWTWKSILGHQVTTSATSYLYIIKNAKKASMNECSLDEVGIKALDPLTLEITLEHPAPYFLDLLVLPIYSPVCRAVAESNPNWAGCSFPDFVCNGPFLLKDRKVKSHITCEKNPLYWNADTAGCHRLHFAIVEDPLTAYNMFEEGSLDWYGDTCGNMSLEMIYELHRKGKLIKRQSGGAHWLICNTPKPHLSSAKIRKAIACALNRSEICDTLLQGGETPSYSIVPLTLTLLKEQSFYENKKEAKALFEEGMKDLGYTRHTYPPLVITHFSDPSMKAIAEIEQQQLQETLGVTVILEANDWGTWLKKFNSEDFELLSILFFTLYPDPTSNLEFVKFKTGGINNTGWEHPEYIRLLNLADQATDNSIRNTYLREAEGFLMQEMPIIPVFYHTFKYAKASDVTGEVLSPAGQMELKWLWKKQ